MNYDNRQFEQQEGGQQEQRPPSNNWNNNGGGYRGNAGNQNSQGGGYGDRPAGGYPPRQGGGQGGYQKGGFNRFQRREEPEGPAEFYKPYVGTGSREIPPAVAEIFKRLAGELEKAGYTLRSGGMQGAEDIFEKATTKSEIHLPWKGFNDKDSKFTFTTNAAKELAAKFHPAWEGLKPFIQTFLAKNVRMIMGKDLKSPALFMILWSEDGAETILEKTARTGDMGHAIAVAHELRIPVFNVQKSDALERLNRYLNLNISKNQDGTA
jgi:hypothetical protein